MPIDMSKITKQTTVRTKDDEIEILQRKVEELEQEVKELKTINRILESHERTYEFNWNVGYDCGVRSDPISVKPDIEPRPSQRSK